MASFQHYLAQFSTRGLDCLPSHLFKLTTVKTVTDLEYDYIVIYVYIFNL